MIRSTYNLYIGDSSDDEEEEIVADAPNHSRISSYLIKRGKDLLNGVKGRYREHKVAIQNEVNPDNLVVDKNLFGDYILYKNKVGNTDTLEQEIINSGTSLKEIASILYPKLYETTHQEKGVFQQIFVQFTKAATDELYSLFKYNQCNQNILSIFAIGETKAFLISLLKKIVYFNKRAQNYNFLADDFLKAFLENKELGNIEHYLSSTKKSKQDKAVKVEEVFLIGVKEFLAENYLGINSKPILKIYEDFQLILGVNLTEFLALHRKWFGTSLGKTYTKFLKTEDTNYQEFVELVKSAFLLELINSKNSEINSALESYRPKELFLENTTFQDNLVKFLIDHRIIRSKIKEQAIKSDSYDVSYNKCLPLDRTSEILEISAKGSRKDLRLLGLEKHNYGIIAEKIQSIYFSDDINLIGRQLRECFIYIINGKGKEYFNNKQSEGFPILHDNQIFLYKLTDLLFNLETERNISAFITNAMFFDLVANKNEEYTIEDLPTKLPMAMVGAVDASRYAYECSNTQKKYRFDFKEVGANIFDFLELDVKNCKLLLDWIEWKGLIQQIGDIGKYREVLNSLQTITGIIADLRLINEEESEKRKKRKTKENLEVSEEKEDVGEVNILEKYDSEKVNLVKTATYGTSTNKKFAKDQITEIIQKSYHDFSEILNLENLDTAISGMVSEWYWENL